MQLIKKIIVIICIFFQYDSYSNPYLLKWTQSIDSVSTLSSPRAKDLNHDHIKDLVLGVGNEYDTINYVVAINSIDGSLLWKTFVDSDIYGSPIFFDVNQDETEDVFITGRKNGLYCLDGKNGDIIWKIDHSLIPDLYDFKYNFYQPQIINTETQDYNHILIITYGGNADLPPHSTERKTGYVLLLDPRNGHLISYDSMPDGYETYYSLQIIERNHEKYVLIGTGGETHEGHLWLCTLSDVLNHQFSQKAEKIDGPFDKGFIQPNLITDINGDETLDIISINFGGHINAIDGKTLLKLWSLSFSGYEIYSPPTPIEFNNQNDVYFILTLCEGLFEEGYKSFKTILINAHDGSFIELNDWGFLYQINGGVSYKAGNQTNFIYSYNSFENEQYQVEYRDIQLPNNTSESISGILQGNNLGASPLLEDLDQDGNAELILIYNDQDFRNPSTVKIKKYNTSIPNDQIIWNNYMGKNMNYIFERSVPTNLNHRNQDFKIQIFPNPAQDIIHIQSNSKIFQIGMFNSFGQEILNVKNVDANLASVKLKEIHKGTYTFLIHTENGYYLSKISVL